MANQTAKEKLLAVIVGSAAPEAAVKLATAHWPDYDTNPDHGRAVSVFVQGYVAGLVDSPAESKGAALIAIERQEQIHKHGWDTAHDADYGKGELVQAAATCLSLYVTGEMASINVAGEHNQRKMWPWQSEFGMTYYAKIWGKSDIDKLKVAGALIAAEIDRLSRLPDPSA